MSRLVSRIVTAARDRHAAFTIQQTPSGPLYRFLATYIQQVRQLIEATDPTYQGIEATLTYNLPLVEFAAGMNLGAGRRPIEVVLLDKAGTVPQRRYPMELISRDQRFAVNRPPNSVWEENGILYLNGVEQNYTNYGTVEVQVVEEMGDADEDALQMPGAVMPLPDAAAGVVIEAMAAFMARRGPLSVISPNEREMFATQQEKAEARFVSWMQQRLVGRRFFTADMNPY